MGHIPPGRGSRAVRQDYPGDWPEREWGCVRRGVRSQLKEKKL